MTFAGEDVTQLSAHAKAARGLVLVPEGRQLFSDMTVEENLEMGAYSHRARQHFKSQLEKVYGLFPRLKERRHQKAGTFSGGEQQMLAIARGLMSVPEILIIDELSLGLAPVIVQQLVETLKALKAAGVTILLVEQNLHLALALCDYAYVIAEGRPFLEGPVPRGGGQAGNPPSLSGSLSRPTKALKRRMFLTPPVRVRGYPNSRILIMRPEVACMHADQPTCPHSG